MKQKNIWLFGVLAVFLLAGNVANAQLDPNKCYQGDKEVPCPRSQQDSSGTVEQKNVPVASPVADSTPLEAKQDWKNDILPANLMADTRNDMVFYSITAAVFLFFLVIGLSGIRIFGKTLGEYIFPIWYYVLGSIVIVAIQYLVVVPYGGQFPYLDRITQAIWALLVVLSVVQQVRKNQFNFGNVLFLGLIYSFLIHGLKVFVRYSFYNKTLFYALDRFVYGAVLVMAVVIIVGAVMLVVNRKSSSAKIS